MPYVFNFYKNQQLKYSANLLRVRCKGKTNVGKKCKLQTYFGIPYCWMHLEKKFSLKIKPSTIRSAGRGLFAYNRQLEKNDIIFHKDDEIIECFGEIVPESELDRRYDDDTGPYAIKTLDGICIDCAIKRDALSFSNHKSRGFNAELLENEDGTRVFLSATKRIYNDSEIFWNYGTNYRFNEEENTNHTTNYIKARGVTCKICGKFI